MQQRQLPGVEILLQDALQEQPHFHPEIEMIYIVEGAYCLQAEGVSYEMKRNDMILVNSSEKHSIESRGDGILCKILISYRILAEVVKDGNYVFYCNSIGNKEQSFEELQKLMKRMVLTFTGKKRKSDCLIQGVIFEVLDLLIEQYRIEGKIQYDHKRKNTSEQLQYIINYVNMNFQDAIHLSDIAEEMYTSTSTLSRFFKKQTGLYFGDFVNQIRLNYAVKDLKESNKSITKIAVDCGFSNPSVFSKSFQKMYQLSPSEYRKQFHKKEECEEEEGKWKEMEERLGALQITKEEHTEVLKREITIASGPGTAYKKFWGEVLNAGTAHNLTLANLQYHILFLKEQLKFKYVRIWNIFSNNLMIQKNENDYNYNFNMVDNVLDFLVNHGMKPFIDFGRRPETAIAGEGTPIYYKEEYIRFKNCREWEKMFYAFFIHALKRYGKEEMEQWIYEISLDPRKLEIEFEEEMGKIEELYLYCFNTVKSYLPNAKVGGMGAIIDSEKDKSRQWLSFCKKMECVPDFISMIGFPYMQAKEEGAFVVKRNAAADITKKQIELLEERLESLGMRQCSIYVTEWNNSLSNRNYLNDSCFRAAYVVQTVEQIFDKPDCLGIFMGSDWISSYFDTVKVANGGSGLLTKDGVRKPVFYALDFLNRLGSGFLQKGPNYIATTNRGQNFDIVCHNCKAYSPAYFMKEEDKLEIDHLGELFEDTEELELHITLQHLPENVVYTVKTHIIDEEHGSLLGQWKKFHYERDMEGNDMKYLRNVCVPDLNMEKVKVENGELKISVKMKAQAIILLQVYESN